VLSHSITASTSLNRVSQEELEVIRSMKPEINIVQQGGFGYKAINLISDKCQAVINLRKCSISRWDACAPSAILASIGGQMTDIEGLPYEYVEQQDPQLYKMDRGVLFTLNSSLHKHIL